MNKEVQPIVSHATDGRVYKLGAADAKRMEVTFKADGAEVANKYSITEWWMEKDSPSVGPHVHETNDELIYVLEGTASVLLHDNWVQMEKGGLVVIPAGTRHGFRNDSDQRVGVLNIFLAGAYEAMMPQIQAMFAHKP